MPRKRVRIVDIEETRAKLGELLGELIDALKPGEWFIISVRDNPKAKVIALRDQEKELFLKGEQRGER
jgi:antitoxin (DNA-binding transcriptional repressor) of toxin-antitoxin stability system